ncbi:MAG: D-alanine--poly(phosphoribitol) ligase subunit 2 [bacterium]
MSVSEEVIAALEVVTADPDVARDGELDLFGLQVLDSLRTIELVVELSARLHTEIALSEIDRTIWATPNRIIAFCENRSGTYV